MYTEGFPVDYHFRETMAKNYADHTVLLLGIREYGLRGGEIRQERWKKSPLPKSSSKSLRNISTDLPSLENEDHLDIEFSVNPNRVETTWSSSRMYLNVTLCMLVFLVFIFGLESAHQNRQSSVPLPLPVFYLQTGTFLIFSEKTSNHHP